MSPGEIPAQALTADAPPPTRNDDKLAAKDVLVIGVLMVAAFTVLLNEMLLGVALPSPISDLHITPTTGQRLTTGYLLTLAILIPATGFLLRRFNLRTIFIGSLSLFTLGMTIAAAAPGFGVLLTGRIIQAVGTAALLPLLMATTMRLVPPNRRGRTMALVTGLTAVAPAVGPAVSGVVISQLSWRWLFILVLPVVLAALALGAAKLRNITTPEPVGLDVPSLVLSALGFGALAYGLSTIGESVSGHAPVAPYIPIITGLLLRHGRRAVPAGRPNRRRPRPRSGRPRLDAQLPGRRRSGCGSASPPARNCPGDHVRRWTQPCVPRFTQALGGWTMLYRRRMTGIDGAVVDDDDVLTLLVERVPETRRLVEEKYGLRQDEAPPTVETGLDLYENLLDLLTRPVLQPALDRAESDDDLLQRCFGFVEDVYADTSEHRRGAVYFQVLECLLDAKPYLENAIPYLRGPVRERVSRMLKHDEVEGYEHGLPSL